jgi:hypothetical protein
MDQDFDYEKALDPRSDDWYVVYPTIKLWHLFLFFAIMLPIVYYFK